jgi:2-methylcitrate dehydratase PrpD
VITGDELIKYICRLTYDDLPDEVVHQVKRAILDMTGAMLIGSKEKEGKRIADFIKKLGCEGNSTIVGNIETCSYNWSAFANACFAQIHDCNDGHRAAASLGGAAHPGRSVIPTALAVGEKLSLSGKDIITAIVIGYDVATRIRKLDKKTAAAAYSSAAVAGKLMGLNETEMFNAIGIAGYDSPLKYGNLMTYMSHDTNFISNGYTAKVGIEAALLAKEGLTGPPIEDDSRLSTRFEGRGLGREFEIMKIYFKPYPTCRMTHGTIEAIFELKAQAGFNASDIEEVEIYQLTHGMYVAEKKVNTESPYKLCQFNLPYIAACAIIDNKVSTEQFSKERIADPEVHKMADRVKVIAAEQMDAMYPEKHRPTLVRIKLNDGSIYNKKIELPRGDESVPLTDNELFFKFKDWTKEYLSEEIARESKELIFNIDRANNITGLLSLLK